MKSIAALPARSKLSSVTQVSRVLLSPWPGPSMVSVAMPRRRKWLWYGLGMYSLTVSMPGMTSTTGVLPLAPSTVCRIPGMVLPFSNGISTRHTGASSNNPVKRV